jgi:hypothetical protein
MILRRAWPSRLVAASVVPLAILGCWGDDSERPKVPVHPARGQVLYKGRPLADALVVLRPINPAGGSAEPPQPTGRTDAEGKFLLHTYAGDDGAPVGSYLVGVSSAPAYPENRSMMKKVEAAPKSAPVSIGTQYADPAKSGLKAEIKAGQNELPTLNLN